MTSPEEPPLPDAQRNVKANPEEKKGKGDAIALGIGCAVFVIMVIAVILVGLSGR